MTVPSGHPDWQDISVKSGQTVYNNMALDAHTAQTVGPFYVGNYGAVLIKCLPSAGGTYILDALWVNNQQASLVVSGSRYRLGNGTSGLRRSLVTAQPWLQVKITPIAAAVGETVTLQITPIVSVARQSELATPMVQEITGQSILAGGQVVANGNYTLTGGANWFVAADGSSAQCDIQAMQDDGTWRREFITPVLNGVFAQSMQVVLPPTLCRLVVNNTGAATANFWSVLGILD